MFGFPFRRPWLRILGNPGCVYNVVSCRVLSNCRPEVVHAPVVELAALVDHSASSLLVLSVADNLLFGDVSTEWNWLPRIDTFSSKSSMPSLMSLLSAALVFNLCIL